jgi:transposase InsO family protein
MAAVSSKLSSSRPADSGVCGCSCCRPAPPQLNGRVERAQRTHTEEFYECYDGDLNLPTLRAAQRNWEQPYNHVRPHQALG